MKQRYKHNCDTCQHIKTAKVKDVYYDFYKCSKGALGTVYLARYGDDGFQYLSYSKDILLASRDLMRKDDICRMILEFMDFQEGF